MSGRIILTAVLILALSGAQAQKLKSIVYDFDGFDLGATSLPEGEYSYGDLSYEVAANPYAPANQLGDRVLKLSLQWNDGYGAFGRGISRFLELSKPADRLNIFIASPLSNSHPVSVELTIADDDDGDGAYNTTDDDSWRTTFTVSPQSGWELKSIPLALFTDHNTGGNGVFDISFSGGQLLLVEMRFTQPQGATGTSVYYIDMIAFSEGSLPQGNTAVSLPPVNPADYCLLGAHMQENPGQYYLIPQHFHSLLPVWPQRRIQYVNTYMQWATNGSTTPHMLPGNGYQQLLNGGYTPVITWEPMFSGYAMNDPLQPSLDEIINGNYDTYIDAFANKLKSYSDTIIIRLMHEFDGDWYPWCVATNGNNPQKYILAFRHVVNRVKQNGATKVKWMWCPNSDFSPQASWNSVVSAYPGDAYVDIVATDVYNSHYPSALPWWRSFRWQLAEVYYYLTKHFPTKPFFICEAACRERRTSEPASSETKAGWIAAMDRDLQTYFSKTRALIFFSENKSEDWDVNSSTAALNSLRDNIWADDYYFRPLLQSAGQKEAISFALMPNPASSFVQLRLDDAAEHSAVLFDLTGQAVLRAQLRSSERLDVSALPRGVYILELDGIRQAKVVLR